LKQGHVEDFEVKLSLTSKDEGKLDILTGFLESGEKNMSILLQ